MDAGDRLARPIRVFMASSCSPALVCIAANSMRARGASGATVMAWRSNGSAASSLAWAACSHR
jgi:hypothetical protein